MQSNWKNGHHSLTRIECHSENSKGVYCLQYDDKKIVSGLRDNTIKVCVRACMRACVRVCVRACIMYAPVYIHCMLRHHIEDCKCWWLLERA